MADQDLRHVWIFPKASDGTAPPAFDFDCVISESHTSKLSVTENPVETGVVVSDHSFMQPRRLEVYGAVSDVWLGMREPDQDKVGPRNTDKDWLLATSSSDAGSRAQRAWAAMTAMQALGTPFSIQTGLVLYQNFVCEELTATQDKRTAYALVFRATLREVIFVSTKTIEYPPRADKATNRKAAPKTTSGEKQAVEPATPAKKVSVFLKAGRATGAL